MRAPTIMTRAFRTVQAFRTVRASRTLGHVRKDRTDLQTLQTLQLQARLSGTRSGAASLVLSHPSRGCSARYRKALKGRKARKARKAREAREARVGERTCA